MDRKFTLSTVALFAFFSLSTVTPVLGQTYPAKPVRIIVPFAAGGGSDVVARLLGPELRMIGFPPPTGVNRPNMAISSCIAFLICDSCSLDIHVRDVCQASSLCRTAAKSQ